MTPAQRKQVFKILTTTTTEQQMYFIQCISEKIIINVPTKKGTICCSIYEPHTNINFNGIYIDINIDLDK